MVLSFSDQFLWGVATSSYQIEGAWNTDGKGESIWDSFCHKTDKIFERHNGDVACDHYHKYVQDIALMKKLGVRGYRFSISWPRVMPNGIGEINDNGLKFYSNLVDTLLENGIEPFVTLYHWDLPQALQNKGGWLNPDSPKWFAQYAKVIVETMGARVQYYMTFNEPQVFVDLAFNQCTHAPGWKMTNKDMLQMAHNVLLAHGMATQAIRASNSKSQIGFAPTSNATIPADPTNQKDVEAATKAYFEIPSNGAWQWSPSWWSDPIFFGKYPEDGMKTLEKDMPNIGQNDMKIISQPLDFYGQNIYRGNVIKATDEGWAFVEKKAGAPRTAIGWYVNEECLYWAPKMLYERYKTPIYITENGISCHDWVHVDGKIHDPQRIDYLSRHLSQLKKAIHDGVDIAGYFQWSFMDNFEWARGYHDRFGLVYVDFDTQERIPKDSFYWYQNLIQKNGIGL